MKKIRCQKAYFKTVVRNSKKNEYRQNDNARKHITPIGDDLYFLANNGTEEIESAISERNPQGWLSMIENPVLACTLNTFSKDDIELLYMAFVLELTQTEIAKLHRCALVTVHKKLERIKKKIKISFLEG